MDEFLNFQKKEIRFFIPVIFGVMLLAFKTLEFFEEKYSVQFAAVGVIGAGGSALSAIATATLLGLRNTLYGAVMSPRLRVRGFKRVIAALNEFGLTAEVHVLSDSARTAQEAANALNIEVGQIASSLIFKLPDDVPLEHGMVSRAIEQAQVKVEGFHFDSRKHLVESRPSETLLGPS